MRITNQMVTGNSMRNMQKSMTSVNKITEQLTTGKKIQNASDDPVIAIRALKLRTTCSQLEQYSKKNIPDANSWLDITATSLDNVTKRIQDIVDYCVQGSTDSFNSDDRSAIVDSLTSLREMINAEGNSTYAGRYIFSGYKTDRSLSFNETEDTTVYSYDIKQNFTPDNIEMVNSVWDGVDATKLGAYLAGTETYNTPNPETVYRLNLGYEGVSDTNNDGDMVLDIDATDVNGNAISLAAYNITVIEPTDAAEYYNVGPSDIHVIKETGEIIFGENVNNTLKKATNIEINYAKNEFVSNDLRPEHYFECTQYKVGTDGIVKETDFTQPDNGQGIFYEVNFNQSLKVNTEGKDLITHEMGNDINDLVYSLSTLKDAESMKSKLQSLLSDPIHSSDADAVNMLNKMIEDINVEIAVKKENMQKIFSGNIEKFQKHLDQISAVQSDLGSRMTKLEMIKTRVIEQFSTFQELKSKNEDVETEEAVIDFNSAKLVYNSALAATGKIITKTLLDYL